MLDIALFYFYSSGSPMNNFIMFSIDVFASLFIVFLGLLVLIVAVFYIRDVTQTKHAIRRNYPVIGRFRYFFERQGEFFRQYFFALDREEMPFNRAERSWVYRAANFLMIRRPPRSTQSLEVTGTVMFMNCAFPTLDEEALAPSEVTLGPYCQTPYSTNSLFNVSGMSFGALSKPAVRALSKGAKLAGCWMNTGEGGLSPYHLEGGADLVFQIGTAMKMASSVSKNSNRLQHTSRLKCLSLK